MSPARPQKWGLFIPAALLAALGLAALVSPFASPKPDGLEKVAADQGFLQRGEGRPAWRLAPLRDYAVPGLKNEKASTALAGLAGTLAVFGAGWGAARLARRRPRPPDVAQKAKAIQGAMDD